MQPRILKQLKCEVATLLIELCNFFLRLASVPEDWKTAKLNTVLKWDQGKVKRNDMPLALTSVLRKQYKVLLKTK